MAISDTQKIDALYKKFGFGVAKTDTASNKSPSNEAIPSPLLVRGDTVWNESDLIPTTPPTATTAVVKVRKNKGDGRVAATADATVSPSTRTWLTGVTNWIPAQFGAGYAVKVYADTAGAANPESTGTLLSPDGSGNNDAYIFDYASGVLNFSDTNLPTALSGKSIFIVGYTYQGTVGLKNSTGLGGGLSSTDGTITTTVENGDLTLSGNGTGGVVLDDNTEVNGTLTATGTVTAPTLAGDVTSTGTSSFNNINVSGTGTIQTLDVNGSTTLEGTTVGGTLGVTGATTLADVTAQDGIFDTITVNGTSDLKGATTVGTVGTNANLTVNGDITATGDGTFNGDLVVSGNLTVSGTQTVIETEILKVADNIITLNNGIGAVAPTENAGLEVDRGTEGTTTIIQWNETTDKVEVYKGGSMLEVATVSDLSGASGDLQNELDATQAGAGLTATGALAAFTGANYVAADTTLRAAIVTLDTNLDRVEDGVGVWGNLTTTSKVVVGAVNELDAEIGNTALTTAATTVKTAINEVDAHADSLYTVLGVTTDAVVTGFDGLNYVTSNATIKGAITLLDTQLRTTTDQVDGKVGTLTSLTTTEKTTLVGAINEVDLHANNLYTLLGETQDATATDYTGANYVALSTTVHAAVVALDTQLKTISDRASGDTGDLGSLTTDSKSTIVGAINEVDLHANRLYTAMGVTQDGTAPSFTGANYVASSTTIVAAITALDTQLKTTTDQVDGNIGTLSTLTTAHKTTLVGAINEVDSHANNLYTALGVAQDGTATDFTGANYVAADTTVTSAITTLDTQLKSTNDNAGTLASLTTASKATLVGAINEVDSHANNLYTLLGETQDGTTTNFTGANYVAAATTVHGAITALDTQLKTTTDQVDGNIGTLSTLTTAHKSTLVGAINEVDSHANNIYTLLGETQDGTATDFTGTNYVALSTTVHSAITALDTQLKATTVQVDGNIGDLADLTTAVKTTIVAAINSEVSRATGVEGTLASLTTTDKSNLVAAINELDSDLGSEVSRAQSAETTLTNNLATEVSNRTSADNALGTRINNVNTAAGITGDAYVANGSANYIAAATSLNDADVKLDTQLKTTVTDLASTANSKGTSLIGYKGYTEADANIVNPAIEIAAGTLESAIADIAASVNLRIHELDNRYVKGEVAANDASDTYTIAHNLDTNFVDVAVQVYDTTDLVWRFDLVVVEVIDVNTVKVSLASGVQAQIRYVIHGY